MLDRQPLMRHVARFLLDCIATRCDEGGHTPTDFEGGELGIADRERVVAELADIAGLDEVERSYLATVVRLEHWTTYR